MGCAVQGCIANCWPDRSIAWASAVNPEANHLMRTKDAAQEPWPYKPVVLLQQLVLTFDAQELNSDNHRTLR